jgi:glycosyltransferase involved in cell wall biosynthesis
LNIIKWTGRPRKRYAIGDAQTDLKQVPADITVIIPAYNHEAFIKETLQSVLAQTYGGYRILVVDDASMDATVDQALSVRDPRITLRVNSHNMGLGNSILSIFPEINTPMVALLNSDDLFHFERLARCRQMLLDSPDTQMVATDVSLIDAEGGCLTPNNVSLFGDGRNIYYWVRWFEGIRIAQDDQIPLFVRLLKNNFLATSSNIVCKTEYLRSRAETLAGLNYCLDWQLFLDASLDERLAYLPEKLVAYRLHARNTVWFTEGRRLRYFLETNRVAACALNRFFSSVVNSDMKGPELERVLRDALMHAAANANLDGLGLFLNALNQFFHSQHAGRTSARLSELIESFYVMAQQTRFKRREKIFRCSR